MIPTFRLLALLLVLIPPVAHTQQSALGNWIVYNGNKKINQSWNLHHEVQYRNYDAIGDLEQLLLRAGVGYTPEGSGLNFLLGYGYILSENYTGIGDNKNAIEEHRVYQQLIAKQWWGRLGATHRYRFEQRWVENDFRTRFRYQLYVRYPIGGSLQSGLKPYLSAYNEIFLNTRNKIFDRNRVYGGLGIHVSKVVRVEVGYMNQRFEVGSRDQINLITFVTF